MKKLVMIIKIEMDMSNNPEFIPESIKYASKNAEEFGKEFKEVLFNKEEEKILKPKIKVEVRENIK